jgi:hypothetical protein
MIRRIKRLVRKGVDAAIYSSLGVACLSRLISNVVSPRAFEFTTHNATEQVRLQLIDAGIPVSSYPIDITHFWNYFRSGGYEHSSYGSYRIIVEKALEHYVAMDLLQLTRDDTYIDVASANSLAPDVYRANIGCHVYRQDLLYQPGLNGDLIGGDAGSMAVPDEFATKMALHCSFEHFEGDADTRLILEIGRVLRQGGRAVIIPLYISPRYSVWTYPVAWLGRGGRPTFDNEALVELERGWRGRFGRVYDVPHFISRVVQHLGPLQLKVLSVDPSEIDPSCYLRFAALLESSGPQER